MCCRGRWDSFEVRPLYGGKERPAFWRAALLLAGSLPALNPRASADCRVKKDRRRRSFETVEKTEREIPAKETGASITRFSDGFSGLKHGRRLESAALFLVHPPQGVQNLLEAAFRPGAGVSAQNPQGLAQGLGGALPQGRLPGADLFQQFVQLIALRQSGTAVLQRFSNGGERLQLGAGAAPEGSLNPLLAAAAPAAPPEYALAVYPPPSAPGSGADHPRQRRR